MSDRTVWEYLKLPWMSDRTENILNYLECLTELWEYLKLPWMSDRTENILNYLECLTELRIS